MKHTRMPAIIIAVVTALLLTAVSVLGATAEEAASATSDKHFSLESATATEGSLTVAEIVKKCQNSIVAITTQTVETYDNGYGYGYGNGYGYGYNPFGFGYGYGNPYGNNNNRQYTVTGSASGIIVSADGYVVTNAHVVEGADSVTVTLFDGTEYDAEVIGYAADNDIAVCKIDAQGLTPATFGDSDTLEVGELAVVIGNPLGLANGAVTSGIISALNYPYEDDEHTINAIQTDAAINQGNSGGALFNSYGEVVGVVFAKMGGSLVDGIGYAIPVNDVKTIIEGIINDPDATAVSTGESNILLGVTITTITDEISDYYSLPKGAYVVEVEQFSAAERAGLQTGDVITAFDGQTVDTAETFIEIKNQQSAGEDVEVEVWRNGQEMTLTVHMPEARDVTTEITKGTQG